MSFSCIFELHNGYLDVQVMLIPMIVFFSNTKHIMANCTGKKCRIFNPSIEIIYKKNVSPLYLPFVECIKFFINKEEHTEKLLYRYNNA